MMNVSLQLHTYETGIGSTGPYIKLHGRHEREYLRATAWGPVANALAKQLGEIIAVGKTARDMHLIVGLKGKKLMGSPYKDATTGEEKRNEFFKFDEFVLHQGPSLELERLRVDAVHVLRDVQADFDKNGNLPDAFRRLAEFTARVGNTTLDLTYIDDIAADMAAAGVVPQASEGVDHDPETVDPEAQAYAHYAAEDRKNGLTAAVEEAAIEPDAPDTAASETPAPAETLEAEQAADEDASIDVSGDQEFVADANDVVGEGVAEDLAASAVEPQSDDDYLDFGDNDDDGDDDDDDNDYGQETDEPETAAQPPVITRPAAPLASPASRQAVASLPARPQMPVGRPPLSRPPQAATPSTGQSPVAAEAPKAAPAAAAATLQAPAATAAAAGAARAMPARPPMRPPLMRGPGR